MVREEIDNASEDMVIDGGDAEQKIDDGIPDGFNANYLKIYYGKFFPYADMHKWMSYGNDGKHPGCDQSYLGRREFSFTLDNDIYLRFQSFNNATELENAIKEKCPFKIDIGPVYSVDPAKRHAYAQSGDNVFTPVERELIFDIDISDYDDVRFCCSGADVCSECWPLMTVAIKVIDTALRVIFPMHVHLDSYAARLFGFFVSKHMNHLLKAPFCVHPKTGRVCVPIDPEHCEEFDPSAVPTLSKLLEELNMGALGNGSEQELENTSIGKSIRHFRSSFLHPLLKSCKEEIESSYAAKIQQSKSSISW
ncbi:hypothetical protein CDL12_06298 [Handroanthus impetiginosus]|uniref:DNA primase n=1 Tax=Handroanthus impetiginosus TaxID=429701 RepID=A0A2G9HU11_9LAMI|nr:hypothetical protein CDL12_06298 [Handroanthus impetiginosus]